MDRTQRLLPTLLLLATVREPFAATQTDNGGWQIPGEERYGIDGPCTVPRVDGRSLTQEEFQQEYAYSTPVIIYNVENSEFQHKCRKEVMLDEWQDAPVVLNSANTYSYTRVSSTFRDYVNNLLKPQNPHTLGNGTYPNVHCCDYKLVSETLYLFGDIDQETWKPLLSSYKQPTWKVPQHEPALSFGIAGAGTGVPFHFHGPGFAEVIHGSKRWFLQPYEQRPQFDPDRTTLHWYLNEYPRLNETQRPMECLMRPGEVIYFPDKWWHATLNSETSVFISTFLSPMLTAKTEL